MDKSWIEKPLGSDDYVKGASEFINFAKSGSTDGLILCPCKDCKVGRKKRFPIEVVENHILFKGFFKEYKNWIFHGPRGIIENLSHHQTNTNECGVSKELGQDDMGGLLRDVFGITEPHIVNESSNENLNISDNDDIDDMFSGSNFEQPDTNLSEKEEAKYRKLLSEANEELYSGCTSSSKLCFLLRIFHIKCMFNWSAKSVSMLIEVLLDVFPQIAPFPSTYYEAQKLVKELGLGYEKIDVCPNDCMLYWGENSSKSKCDVCHTPRWKTSEGVCEGTESNEVVSEKGGKKSKGSALKVMRYFPLIPRLKRMYQSSKSARDMRWHEDDRIKDGILRHPADGVAWKDFDARYPEFASDPRNVRIALASDGFNPYRQMNTNYSMWPIVLIVYNLPPWLCMKQFSLILSSIIPGKSSPGNDIDVYMQPLLHELKCLWEGVDIFDAHVGQTFKLRAALLGTINDFPAYAMLSGWSTKGYKACPYCTELTDSCRCGSKICYGGHRKWLAPDHPFRSQKELFDGTEEYNQAPTRSSGSEILRMQEKVQFEYGKNSKVSKKRARAQEVGSSRGMDMDDEDVPLWTKKSIFFSLPYWEHNLLRHNLDVMHIEKNVCENLLVTLLNVKGKCKDDERTRRFLQEKGLRSHLWLKTSSNGETSMPPAPYHMSPEEKERFLNVLTKLKVPDGYASNISRCVDLKKHLKKCTLSKLKSHDHHVLMQDILPIALQASRSTQVRDVISDLSTFFKLLCSKTLDVSELDDLQAHIIVTICELEMNFLPPFFTIMVHLMIHLVEEVKLGGPVHYRWMYPIEIRISRMAQNSGALY